MEPNDIAENENNSEDGEEDLEVQSESSAGVESSSFDDSEFWDEIDEELTKMHGFLCQEAPLAAEEIEFLVELLFILEGKAQDTQELMEDESISQTRQEVIQEMMPSYSGLELEKRVEEEMESHILLLEKRHSKLEDEISLLQERLEEYVKLPEIYKIIEKQVPEYASTTAWKERSHWAGCERQRAAWRYDAEDQLEMMGPIQRTETDIVDSMNYDDVEELADLENSELPNKVTTKDYALAVHEEKIRDAEQANIKITKVNEEEDHIQEQSLVSMDMQKLSAGKKARTYRTGILTKSKKRVLETPSFMSSFVVELPYPNLDGIAEKAVLVDKVPAIKDSKAAIIDLSSDSEEGSSQKHHFGQNSQTGDENKGQDHSEEQGSESKVQGSEVASVDGQLKPDYIDSGVNEIQAIGEACPKEIIARESSPIEGHTSKYEGLSVSSLVELIKLHGGNRRGCIEKKDLVAKLLELESNLEITNALTPKGEDSNIQHAIEGSHSVAHRTRKRARIQGKIPNFELNVASKVQPPESDGAEPSDKKKGIVCTICARVLQVMRIHPKLPAPICNRCRNDYKAKKFTMDEEGIQNQCIWCGKEGSLFICDNAPHCSNTVCKSCIKRNLGQDKVPSSQLVNWQCFICDPAALKHISATKTTSHAAATSKSSSRRIRRILTDDEQSTKAKAEQEMEEERKIRQAKWEAEARLRAKAKWSHGVRTTEYDDEEDNPFDGISINKARGKDDAPLRIDPAISQVLKPHQVEGIRFIWNNCIDSLQALSSGHEGRGCILAHCMGLGKTLQVVAFVHTVLTAELRGLKTVMIVLPINVLFNWREEFEKWQRDAEKKVSVFMFEDVSRTKNLASYAAILKQWQEKGGVFLIGYPKFRNFSLGKFVLDKEMRDSFCESLQNPGADILICDEAHMIKNIKAQLSQELCRVRTKRRIALTGSPLQNNLLEYYYMINFVRDEHLGTEKAFRNRFLNPIKNGEHSDASLEDTKLMKGRIYALKKKVEGFLQRKGMDTLVPYLPKRSYFVLAVRLSPWQRLLYEAYLKSIGMDKVDSAMCMDAGKSRLFPAYCELGKVCNSPEILRSSRNLAQQKSESVVKAAESSDPAALALGEDADDPKTGELNEYGAPIGVDAFETGEERCAENPLKEPWYHALMQLRPPCVGPDSGKLFILLEIIQQAQKADEKVLVFTHSLSTLDRIETLFEGLTNSEGLPWKKGQEYFRIDGSVTIKTRQESIKKFNSKDNRAAKAFILSTKAGGLGINLTGASKVVLMDGSWNPTFDLQAIYRAWRMGQEKEVTAYRLLSSGTMEEKLYNQQVNKEVLAARVLDQANVARHFTNKDLEMIFTLDSDGDEFEFGPEAWLNIEGFRSAQNNDNIGRSVAVTVNGQSDAPLSEAMKGTRAFCMPDTLPPKDAIMQRLLLSHRPKWIVRYHEHDNLLKDLEDEKLPDEELKKAWNEVQKEIEAEERVNQLLEARQVLQAQAGFMPALPVPPQPGYMPTLPVPPQPGYMPALPVPLVPQGQNLQY